MKEKDYPKERKQEVSRKKVSKKASDEWRNAVGDVGNIQATKAL
jgi:hypothetical protein